MSNGTYLGTRYYYDQIGNSVFLFFGEFFLSKFYFQNFFVIFFLGPTVILKPYPDYAAHFCTSIQDDMVIFRFFGLHGFYADMRVFFF